MDAVAAVLLLALLQYVAFGMLVGWARGRYGVRAPSISGHEIFERYFRVHQNTLELLIAFVPAVWLFGAYVDHRWAAMLGLVYVAGRLIYLRSYVRDPSRREAGFALSILPVIVLIIGGLWGALRRLL